MSLNLKYFFKKQLPFTKEMNFFWKKNGFLIINDFYSEEDCDELRNRAKILVKKFDSSSNKSIFNTKKQKKVEDKYFLESGDKIRFFFEEDAFDKKGNLNNSIELLINKIGHALHDLDNVFYEFSHKIELDKIAKSIGITKPLLLQSMYIFKQPKIGGEVSIHQDSTFLYTDPEF